MAVANPTSVGQRRVAYGANVAIQIGLVVFVAIAAVALTKNRGQVDLTRRGVNSLSPRTVSLVRGLDENIRITAIYTVLSEYDELAQKRQDMVRDLLGLYESRGGGNITARVLDPMEEQADLVALFQRLRELPAYRDEAKPHAEALEAFPELNLRIVSLLDQQLADAQRLLNDNAELQRTALAEMARGIDGVRQRAEEVNASLKELLEGDVVQYGKAAEEIEQYLDSVDTWAGLVDDWLQKAAGQETGMTPEALAFVERIEGEYAEILPEVTALRDKVAELERVSLEDVWDQLSRWTNAPPILVETEEKAEVISFNEVWPFQRDPSAPPAPDGDQRRFAGEQAISSTILRLTQKEKTAIVFVRYGGPSPIVPDFSRMNRMNMRQMPKAPFGSLNDLLLAENFITEDWDVKTQKTPPVIEDAARVVYLVMPPTPPERPNPMQPQPDGGITPEDIQVIQDAVDESGKAIFLASATSPMMGGTGDYEFADYLSETWGVDVQHEYIVLRFRPSPQDPELMIPRNPPMIVDTGERNARVVLEDHPITEPLKASGVGFVSACPVGLVEEGMPEGVDIEPIAAVEDTEDVWAVEDVMRLERDFQEKRGTNIGEDDLPAPFPLAVAATRSGGEEAAEPDRLVVYGSLLFLANEILDMPGGYVLAGGALRSYPKFPGNPDLLINTVHWLTDEADRISVGARRTEIPRLDKLEEGFWMDFWRVFLVGIWPAMALVVGGGVWLFRRR